MTNHVHRYFLPNALIHEKQVLIKFVTLQHLGFMKKYRLFEIGFSSSKMII